MYKNVRKFGYGGLVKNCFCRFVKKILFINFSITNSIFFFINALWFLFCSYNKPIHLISDFIILRSFLPFNLCNFLCQMLLLLRYLQWDQGSASLQRLLVIWLKTISFRCLLMKKLTNTTFVMLSMTCIQS